MRYEIFFIHIVHFGMHIFDLHIDLFAVGLPHVHFVMHLHFAWATWSKFWSTFLLKFLSPELD